ncbi:MAG: DUF4390 domain-containing protein [Gammaproteobacteria bacterium]
MRILLLLSALCCLLFGGVPRAAAKEIEVIDVRGQIVGEFYFVDADVRIELGDDAEDAVESGVPLQFDFDFEVRRPRRLLWDSKILTQRRTARLERHALANKYVVTDLVTHQRVAHGSMAEALEALGRLSAITLGRVEALVQEPGLRGRLRAQLDIEALPAPMRPVAYVSPAWHMKSKWYEWEISQ